MKPHAPLLELLARALPAGFCTALAPAYEIAYAKADKYANSSRDWGEWGARYLRGHFRHVLTNEALMNLAVEYQLQVEFEAVETGSADFLKVATENLIITTAPVATQSKLPDRAKYREQYSEINHFGAQRELFRGPGHVKAIQQFYALIIHRPALIDSSKLGLLEIAFPNPQCTSWFDRFSINEVIELQNSVYSSAKSPREREQESSPELKKGKARKGAS